MTATNIILLTVSIMLVVQGIISICYIVKSIKYRRMLDDILHYMINTDGMTPHDQLRINQVIKMITGKVHKKEEKPD